MSREKTPGTVETVETVDSQSADNTLLKQGVNGNGREIDLDTPDGIGFAFGLEAHFSVPGQRASVRERVRWQFAVPHLE